MQFVCFDLETNGINVAECEVAQAAAVRAPCVYGVPDVENSTTHSTLCAVSHMPTAAATVHGLTLDKLTGTKPFGAYVRRYVEVLTSPNVVAVSFNGCNYDIPILERYHARIGKCDIRSRHVDVFRLWELARRRAVASPWFATTSSLIDGPAWPQLTADMFAGSLKAAHAFYFGTDFAAAHNAEADCTATLRVLEFVLRTGLVKDVTEAIHWSTHPLPGDVDMQGKFRWEGDRAVITIGDHAGKPIEQVDSGFLQWMLKKDFAPDTKHLVREFLAGGYPVRKYEDEVSE